MTSESCSVEERQQAEIARLNKVIRVLIDRAERSTSLQGSDFNLFQTTLMLEKRVGERTAALHEALADNEKINRALRQSARELEATQQEQRTLIEELKAAQVCLQESERELRQHRDHLSDLVAEQTADLVRAKETAEHANVLKSEFLANMSHEFRTPLHAIISYADLGLERAEKLAPEKVCAYFKHIDEAARRLTELVDKLLDLAQLESQDIHLSFGRVDMLGLLAEVEEEQRALLDARGLEIELDVLCVDTFVPMDAQRVKQVVRALYTNAIKYSPQGGRIEVCLKNGDGGVAGKNLCLSVRDHGPGIPVGEEEAIFDKFIQSSVTKTGAGGVGLGLSVAREIVHLHKGRLLARNAPEGGAVFELDLPG